MRDYHVLFSVNYNYFPYVFVACQSILDNLEDREENAQERLVFHIIVDETVPKSKAENIPERFAKLNEKSKLPFTFDVRYISPELIARINSMQASADDNFSPGAFYRLVFSQTLPPFSAHILYLDVDLMVLADVRELFNGYTLQDKILAGVSHGTFYHYINYDDKNGAFITLASRKPNVPSVSFPYDEYLNSGVLLINRDNWDEAKVFERCMLVDQNWKELLYDQDLLMVACYRLIEFLPWDWNVCYNVLRFAHRRAPKFNNQPMRIEDLPFNVAAPKVDDIPLLIQHPKIVHFTSINPWNINFDYELELINETELFDEWRAFRKQWLNYYRKVSSILKN